MDIKIIDSPPPKISYDDILSSLQMTIVNGKLQITRNDVYENQTKLKDQLQPLKSTIINKVTANPILYQQELQRDRRFHHLPPPPRPPLQQIQQLSPQEERKQAVLKYIQQHNDRVRARQIKSKKLRFIS